MRDSPSHYHFPRLWAARHEDWEHTFANGVVYTRADRRSNLRRLIGAMRRDRANGYVPN